MAASKKKTNTALGSTSTGLRKPDWYQDYRLIGSIGEGRYAYVFLAKSLSPREFCKPIAIKKIKRFKYFNLVLPSTIEKLMLLRDISHENLVKLLDILGDDTAGTTLYLVLEYVHYDLTGILNHHKLVLKQAMDPYKVKSILWQMLNGLTVFHKDSLPHQGIKPSNIMIMDGGKDHGVVKLDYALSGILGPPLDPLYQHDIVAWYRAPESLLGRKYYSTAVDMWAVGCVFAELLTLSPLFPGQAATAPPSNIQPDILYRIFMVLGHPTVEKWPTITDLPHWQKNSCDVQGFKFHGSILHGVVNLSQNDPAYDLLSKMLQYDPQKRITAAQALEHEYFRIEPLPGRNTLVPYMIYPPRSVYYQMPADFVGDSE